MASAEADVLAGQRATVLAGAAGRVLEIGGGTGANLPFYGAGVAELVIAEPDEPMARRLERRLGGYRIPARLVRAPAERPPFEAGNFDIAVSTLVLCTVADPVGALAELRRPPSRASAAGFSVEDLRRDTIPHALPIVWPLVAGAATLG